MTATILKQNNAETGLADGTTATGGAAGNTDDGTAGDYFDNVIVGASNTIQCTTSSPWAGTRSWRFVKASVNQCYVGWIWTGAQADFGVRIGFRFPAGNLAAEDFLLRMFADTGYVTQVSGVSIESGAGRRIRAYSNQARWRMLSGVGVMALATDYVALVRLINGGNVTVEIYPKGSPTLTTTVTLPVSANSINAVRLGPSAGVNSAQTFILDDVAVGFGDWLDRTDYTPAGDAVPRLIMPPSAAMVRASRW